MPQKRHSADLTAAIEAARLGGEIIRSLFRTAIGVDEKGAAGVVTQADRDSEHAITTRLKMTTEHAVRGEEHGVSEGKTGKWWIVDPLDGTTNFSRGIPLFAVSVALLEESTIHIGVIYDVMSDRLYSAEKGQGAFCNDTQLFSVTRVTGKPIVFVNSGYAAEDEERAAVLSRNFSGRYSTRKFGSTALELCYVAAGHADAFLSAGDELWDYAAGLALVQESGGAVSDWKGAPWRNANSFVLAGRADLLPALVEFTSVLQPT